MLPSFLAAALVSFLALPIHAEELWYGNFVYDTTRPGVLVLNGPIGRNAVEDFRKAIREHNPDLLALNSPGGSVSSGLELSAIVGDRRIETYIPSSAECASACSFIFFAGNPRTAYGNLGVHQFATVGDGVVRISEAEKVTQEVAGKIMAYLHEFNTPSKVYVRMFETPPDEMYWFTKEEIHNEGIEISTTTILPMIAFAEAPIQTPVDDASTTSPPTTATARPSFDCAKASTPSEYSICGDNTLSALDANMGDLYANLQNTLSSSTFSGVRSAQRQWLAKRDACGASVPCLIAVYRQRITQLGG